MDLFDWPFKFLLSFLIGSVIGLEREISQEDPGNTKGNKAVLGVRSFSLVAGLGALTAVLFLSFPIFAAVVASLFSLLLLIFYYLDSNFTKDVGITTEISLIYTYLIGFLIFTGLLPFQLIVAITVLLVLLMSRKEDIKDFVANIQKRELNALISFAILALVVLPFLPNESFSLSSFPGANNFFTTLDWNLDKITNLELFNPFKLWFIVVLITGVDLFGYLLERTLGKNKGWVIASLVGGFVSSTATTISIAQNSKKVKQITPLLASATFANLVSFVPIALLLISLNPGLFISFLPVLLSLFISALAIGVWQFRQALTTKKSNQKDNEVGAGHSIFSLTSALKFVAIYLVINIISKVALEFFGTGGFLLTTALGSLTGVDAVVINTAQLAGNRIDMNLAVWALILANAVNLSAKSVYSYLQGSREFAIKFFLSMLLIIVTSITVGIFITLGSLF